MQSECKYYTLIALPPTCNDNGDTATCTHDPGFDLDGDDAATCTDTGDDTASFQPDDPTCQGKLE